MRATELAGEGEVKQPESELRRAPAAQVLLLGDQAGQAGRVLGALTLPAAYSFTQVQGIWEPDHWRGMRPTLVTEKDTPCPLSLKWTVGQKNTEAPFLAIALAPHLLLREASPGAHGPLLQGLENTNIWSQVT